MAADVIRRRVQDPKGTDRHIVRGLTARQQGQPEEQQSHAFHAIHLGVIPLRRQTISNICNELVELFFSRRPRAHQPINVGFNEVVKTPAALAQIRHESVGHSHKNRVRLAGKHRFGAKRGGQFLREQLRAFV